MHLQRVLRISRPRFRIYELGPYMIGLIAGMALFGVPWDKSMWFLIAVFFLYFLIPANIWIYGINDIYDYETDKLNPKKQAYEALVEPKEHLKLWRRIAFSTLPFLLFIPWEIAPIVAFLLFLFFSGQYSAKPIRAKGLPLLDMFFSAWHYVTTALFWFLLIAGPENIGWMFVLAALAWAMAMHAFSAVPDIQADKEWGVDTVATLLWGLGTIFLCLLLYLLAGSIAFFYHWILGLLGVLYIALMIVALWQYKKWTLFSIYKIFPRVNTLSGMVLFFVVLSRLLG